MTMPDLPDTIRGAITAIRSGSLSAFELVESCFQRIRQLNTELNAFLYIAEEEARTEALAADTRLRRGQDCLPLQGIPLAIKDLIDVAGMPMTVGSRFFSDHVSVRDATVIQRLKAHGAIVIGKTHLQEFAFSATQPNQSYGIARNPWNTELSPGGTSGGSGVAVASGMCPGALGSDTGGSIRLPAALCGLTGLRPATGTIDMQGVFPRSKTLDTVGPMAHTVEDVALLLEAMTIPGVGTPLTKRMDRPVVGLRIGVPVGEYFWLGAEASVLASVQGALGTLDTLGLDRVDVTLESVEDAVYACSILSIVEALAVHGDRLTHHLDYFSEYVRERLLSARKLPPIEHERALEAMHRWQAELERVFHEQVDLIVTPATPVATHPIGPTEPVSSPTSLIRYVYPFSTSGLPSLSLPCGFISAGMPVGMQFIGPDPGLLLQVAYAYQRQTDWHRRRPILHA